jgi:hypothetical protein
VSEDDDSEIVSESYRRRVRVMGRLMAPFDVLELLLVIGGIVGAIVLAIKAW